MQVGHTASTQRLFQRRNKPEEATEEHSVMASGQRHKRTGNSNWKISLDEGKQWKQSFLESEIHIHHQQPAGPLTERASVG